MSDQAPLAHWLAETGAIVGGSAAIGGVTGYVVGSLAKDAGLTTKDPIELAERGVQLGGIFGLVVAFTSTLRSHR
jgi:hypothetical protein